MDAKQRNALRVIHPYREFGTWVFDDAAVGLVKEPFVAGIDVLLDRKAEELETGEALTIVFSEQSFPGADLRLDRIREEARGNWYADAASGQEGWLCPALYRYFTEAPDQLWLQVKARRA